MDHTVTVDQPTWCRVGLVMYGHRQGGGFCHQPDSLGRKYLDFFAMPHLPSVGSCAPARTVAAPPIPAEPTQPFSLFDIRIERRPGDAEHPADFAHRMFILAVQVHGQGPLGGVQLWLPAALSTPCPRRL